MKMIKIKRVFEARYDFPISGEHLVVGETENGRIFFSSGDLWPEDGHVPAENAFRGNSKITYFETLNEAIDAFKLELVLLSFHL